MGRHAFDEDPEQVAIYRGVDSGRGLALDGVEQGWNMAVVRNVAVLSGDVEYGGVDHFVLTYHVGGGRVWRLDEPDFRGVAAAGAISVQAPQSRARFESDPGNPVEYAHFYFQRSLIEEVADGVGSTADLTTEDFFAVRDLQLETDLRAYAARAARGDDPATALEMDSRANLIGVRLLTQWRQATPARALRPGRLDERRLARVDALIEERLSEDLRLQELADAAALSPFHFARAFKAATGVAPAAYVMRRRLERAQELLARSVLPIAVVALQSGFSSQSHLTRRLKAATGLTPAAFRSTQA